MSQEIDLVTLSLVLTVTKDWTTLSIDPLSSDLPTSLPIPSAVNAKVMPAGQYSGRCSLAQF